jgi:hypothetical protein
MKDMRQLRLRPADVRNDNIYFPGKTMETQ